MLSENLVAFPKLECAQVTPDTDMDLLAKQHPWLLTKKLVAKPDQLFTKKGKNNLVLLNADYAAVKKFIKEHMGKETEIGGTKGKLTHFIVEPFIPHDGEYFFAILSERNEDVILFSDKGGMDVEEHWDKLVRITVPVGSELSDADLQKKLPMVPKGRSAMLFSFIKSVYRYFVDADLVYLESNPLAFDSSGNAIALGLVVEVDDCAAFKDAEKWGELEFPDSFGREPYPEEKFISSLDAKTGASLKLTVINPKGRIWLLVAGGGASVIYTDTVIDLGKGNELGNYGEYSGDPNEAETYQYAKTVLDLATRYPDSHGKVLMIGGGVANFTDVAKTFKGIIRALREYKDKLKKNNFKIFVRRGGPNYEEGLAAMRKLGKELGIETEVYGPETHMTKIVSLAVKNI